MDYVTGKRKDILKDICKRVKELSENLYKKHCENPEFIPYDYFSELGKIETTLEHIILPYFEQMGTQKSFARAKASRENGKKGGRPPKAISELRKRLAALNDFCTDVEEWSESTEYAAKDNERLQIETELKRITQEWERKRQDNGQCEKRPKTDKT